MQSCLNTNSQVYYVYKICKKKDFLHHSSDVFVFVCPLRFICSPARSEVV